MHLLSILSLSSPPPLSHSTSFFLSTYLVRTQMKERSQEKCPYHEPNWLTSPFETSLQSYEKKIFFCYLKYPFCSIMSVKTIFTHCLVFLFLFTPWPMCLLITFAHLCFFYVLFKKVKNKTSSGLDEIVTLCLEGN